MNKYIIEILKIQSSVILPGFGSLMIANSATGKIVFNPHLKFNDGALARYIAEKEGLDVQGSQNQVAKFVREIEAELAKGNGYDMFEFGSFKKGKDGTVEFTMHEKGAVIPNDKPKAAESKPKVEDKVKEAPKAEKLDKKELKAQEKQKAADEEAAKKLAEKEKEKAKLDAEKAETDKKLADAKAADQAKADAAKLADEKAAEAKKNADAKTAEVKKAEETKHDKNIFVSGTDKKTEPAKEETKSDKPSAIERALGDPIKAAEIKTETKKVTSQEKNVFTPSEEKKSTGTSAAAATALAAAGQKPVVDTSKKEEPVKSDDAGKTGTDPKAKKQKPAAKPKKEKKEGEKKKNRWPLIIILIILLGGGGAAGYIFKDKIMAFVNGTEATTDEHEEGTDEHVDGDNGNHAEDLDETTDETTDELVEDETTDETTDEVVQETVVETVVDNSTGGNYHVIGNAFSESGNADAYVSQMKSKGYGSAKVLGRFDNLYMVSIQQFDSRSAAASGASSAGDGAWVFKYPK